MATTSRSDPGGGVVGFAIVLLTVVLSAIGFPIPFAVYVLLIVVGTVLAVRSAGVSGFGFGALVLAAIVLAMSLVPRVLARPAEAPDLEEPIPVPAEYGFKLDPDSTNLEHKYGSQGMPPNQAEFAAVEVVDYYINRLPSEWTVVSRQELPRNLEVQLRQGDTSRGIIISVSVVTLEGRPAVLVLRIRTLLCGDDLPQPSSGECMAAPVNKLVRYPGGGPVSSAEPSTGPLREPVPLPPGYRFALVAGISSEQVHDYVSTPHEQR